MSQNFFIIAVSKMYKFASVNLFQSL